MSKRLKSHPNLMHADLKARFNAWAAVSGDPSSPRLSDDFLPLRSARGEPSPIIRESLSAAFSPCARVCGEGGKVRGGGGGRGCAGRVEGGGWSVVLAAHRDVKHLQQLRRVARERQLRDRLPLELDHTVLDGGVPVVLDRVVGAAGEEASDLGPPVACRGAAG